MVMKKEFQGIYTAILTPFNKDLEINYDLLEELITFQENNNISGLIPCGTNGEFPSLTLNESKKVIETVVNKSKNLNVIAGIGRSSLKETIELAKFSEKIADAVMIVPPFYYKNVSIRGLYEYYSRISNNLQIPYFIYNIPKYSGISITPELISKLSRDKNFIGIKDSSGDINITKEFINKFPDYIIFGGSDALILESLKVGAKGVISALGNVFPSKVNSVFELYCERRYEEAEEAQGEITNIRKIFKEFETISAFKLFLEQYLLEKSYVRPPLVNLTQEEFQKLKQKLSKFLN